MTIIMTCAYGSASRLPPYNIERSARVIVGHPYQVVIAYVLKLTEQLLRRDA